MDRTKYERCEIEVIVFDESDVIVTSSEDDFETPIGF